MKEYSTQKSTVWSIHSSYAFIHVSYYAVEAVTTQVQCKKILNVNDSIYFVLIHFFSAYLPIQCAHYIQNTLIFYSSLTDYVAFICHFCIELLLSCFLTSVEN